MTFDSDARVRILCQPLRLALECRLIFGINIKAVGFKQDAVAELANLLQEIFLTAGHNLTSASRIWVGWRLAIIGAFGDGWQVFDLFLTTASNKRGRNQQKGGHFDRILRHDLLLKLSPTDGRDIAELMLLRQYRSPCRV